MNTMKSMTALLLVLVLSVSLMGCGKDTDIAGSITPAADPVPVTTEAPQETESVSLGRMEGGVYTNEYAGIGCQLDSNWTFYTAEELQELPDRVHEALQDTEYSDTGLNQITDMMAENTTDLTTMNVQYNKLSMQDRLVFAAMSDDAIADVILGQSESMTQAYAQAGIENAVLEKKTVTFLGEERTAVHTTASIQGVPYYILQVFDYGLGQYSVTVTVSSYFEDNTESLLDLFYAVE